MDGHDPVADPWWWCPGDAADGDAGSSSVDMFDGHDSTEDLLELLWQAGGEGDATGKPEMASSRLPSSPPPAPTRPPSEDVMAAWLYPIVSGQDLDHGDCPPVTKEVSKSKGKRQATDGMLGSKDTSIRRSDSSLKKKESRHSAAHSATEKRRRCKINERLRTLQQLVPGCKKSNQAATLDQTIRYMKSLQQHVQAMIPPAVAYPLAMPMPPTVAAAAVDPGTVVSPVGMVQSVVMLPYPHHHTVMMPAAPWYPQAPDISAAPPDASTRKG